MCFFDVAHRTQSGKVFAEPGLWSLTPGSATQGGTDAILFTAGISNQQDGLLGVLRKDSNKPRREPPAHTRPIPRAPAPAPVPDQVPADGVRWH